MTILVRYYKEDNRHVDVHEFESVHDYRWYDKYKMFNIREIKPSKEYAHKMERYIRWSEHVGLVRSKRRWPLLALKRKQASQYEPNPPGFDHTSVWRRPGESWPILVLTEPYRHATNDEERTEWQKISDESGLSFKEFKASNRSLHYPMSTRMVFWWNPKTLDFDEKLFMGHAEMEYVG
tara:strand:- start:203 stop:739 length:537 start_codon:yes stop_codon:yes gene_type:complete